METKTKKITWWDVAFVAIVVTLVGFVLWVCLTPPPNKITDERAQQTQDSLSNQYRFECNLISFNSEPVPAFFEWLELQGEGYTPVGNNPVLVPIRSGQEMIYSYEGKMYKGILPNTTYFMWEPASGMEFKCLSRNGAIISITPYETGEPVQYFIRRYNEFWSFEELKIRNYRYSLNITAIYPWGEILIDNYEDLLMNSSVKRFRSWGPAYEVQVGQAELNGWEDFFLVSQDGKAWLTREQEQRRRESQFIHNVGPGGFILP